MRRIAPWLVVLVVLTIATPARAAQHLSARALKTAPADVKVIAQNGFGDARNTYAWSMARFHGKIYVGTGRLVMCVENETVDFFLKVSQRYVTEPTPGAHCPPNPYDMNLRAEIWEYTPSTGKWRMAYRSPADIPNPRAKGKVVARDIAFRGMVVYRGRLYIGGVTADEYLPELKLKHPPRMLSTADGVHFRATPATDVVVRMPYGDFRPMGIRTMRVWNGKMYVTLLPGLTGDGAIFRVDRPWSPDHARFTQITPKTLAVFETELFDGSLWAGTGDRDKGYGVYRIVQDGNDYRFKPVVTGGAGRGQVATSVVSMKAFDGHLYVGASGWYNPQQAPISEMIRVSADDQWQLVTGSTRAYHGQVKWPITGLGDGFGNFFSAHFWRMATYRNGLVVGTNDWSYLVPTAFPQMQPATAEWIDSLLQGEYGFDLWGTCDGVHWVPITRNAFGQGGNDFGGRTLVAAPEGLYVGSANHARGATVWLYTGSPCPKRPLAPRADEAWHLPLAPPQAWSPLAQFGGGG